MKKVLITGAAGFLGSHLCDRFIKEGIHVIAMDNLITGTLEDPYRNLKGWLIGYPEFTGCCQREESQDPCGLYLGSLWGSLGASTK